ncbi:MAG: phosphohistidine swiveling domain-containing protein [Gammaproteobacteria bacterium]|jgi:phosphohistidine swiveling domain-containing protein
MIIQFGAVQATDSAIVGGKAASLGRMTQAGFPVPPGFTIATSAQAAFFAAHDLDKQVQQHLASANYDDAVALEQTTAKIRSLIESHALPQELADLIKKHYAELGPETYVAVRSSGTAEDLAGASFAGLHDTYLDVRGIDALIDAIRRCWASMWTARATAYRERGGFDHATAQIAVIIQRMIESEVSGVMFTANPLTSRTDEIVINASWGLGEGIVSGILTPDEYVVSLESLNVKQHTIGEKEVQVVRSPDGIGTVTKDVPLSLRETLSLSADKAMALAQVGRDVMAFYEGIPQDLEWALAGGELYLLQSRPITGVEFTWDEDVDAWHTAPENEDTIWAYTWCEQFLTGGITPLFSSLRARECENNWTYFAKLYGFDEITNVRWFKYRRATMFFNVDAEKIWQKLMWPSALRDLTNIPPVMQADYARDETSLVDIAQMWARLHVLEPKHGLTGWFKNTYSWIDGKIEEANGPSADALRRASDAALKKHCDQSTKMVEGFFETLWPGFSWIAPGALGLLNVLLTKWYDGDAPAVFQDLIAGIPDTALVIETHDLWHLADAIRQSEKLTACLHQHENAAFFNALKDFEEGREFLEKYTAFLVAHGHRGHQDRDIYYKRRIEDPQIDYQAFRALENAGESSRPENLEARLLERRQAATDEVLSNLASQPLGGLKAEVFKAVLAYNHRFLKFRDDERHFLDRMTLQKKHCFSELGQRLFNRGLLDAADDFYFLAHHELYELFDGRGSRTLSQAKANARRIVFNRRNAREEFTPTYIQYGLPIDLDNNSDQVELVDGVLGGVGTSRGEVTGRARVVLNMSEIGKVEKDDILICNSTDPGWMPVFPLIKGLVLETGGMLAHGACLSREYGLPAVQLRNAIQLIHDGALISVNGDNGQIRVLDEVA